MSKKLKMRIVLELKRMKSYIVFLMNFGDKNSNKWKGGLLIALLLTVMTGWTQPLRFSLSVAPVLAFSETDFEVNKKPFFGSKLGFEAAYYFRESYALSAGVEISRLGTRMEHSDHNIKLSAKYLDIPLRIRLSTEEIGYWTFYGKFGLIASYKTSEEVKIDPKPILEPQDRYLTDFMGSLEFGIGAEYNFGGPWSLFSELSFRNNFTNALRHDTPPFSGHERLYLNGLALSFGVIF
jgi:hypothetical protein